MCVFLCLCLVICSSLMIKAATKVHLTSIKQGQKYMISGFAKLKTCMSNDRERRAFSYRV